MHLAAQDHAYLIDILALELADERVKAVVVSFDADCAEDAFHIICGRRGVTAEAEKKVRCEMLHCGRCYKVVSL